MENYCRSTLIGLRDVAKKVNERLCHMRIFCVALHPELVVTIILLTKLLLLLGVNNKTPSYY